MARRDLPLAEYGDLLSWVPLLLKAAVEKAVYTAYTQQAMGARGPTPDYLQVVLAVRGHGRSTLDPSPVKGLPR